MFFVLCFRGSHWWTEVHCFCRSLMSWKSKVGAHILIVSAKLDVTMLRIVVLRHQCEEHLFINIYKFVSSIARQLGASVPSVNVFRFEILCECRFLFHGASSCVLSWFFLSFSFVVTCEICVRWDVMATLHLRRWARVWTWTQVPHPMATLYYAEHVHIAQTQIPLPKFCKGQESESCSVPESVSGNVNEPS